MFLYVKNVGGTKDGVDSHFHNKLKFLKMTFIVLVNV